MKIRKILLPLITIAAFTCVTASTSFADSALRYADLSDQEIIPDNITRTNADSVWDKSTGEGVGVAVLASGVDSGHPDLTGNVSGVGKECLKNDGYHFYKDYTGVGTEQAGIIAAKKGNGEGVVGMAPNATIFSVRVGTSGWEPYVPVDALICGLDWIKAYNQNQMPNDTPIRVAVIPTTELDTQYVDDDDIQALKNSIRALKNSGVTLISDAGNDWPGQVASYPATYDEVIATTSLSDTDGLPCSQGADATYGAQYALYSDVDDHPSAFSAYASNDDLGTTVMAPGYKAFVPLSRQYSAYGDLYRHDWLMSGTHVAAAHVAGLAALIYERYERRNIHVDADFVLEKLKQFGEYPGVNFHGECSNGLQSHNQFGSDGSGGLVSHPEPVIRADFLFIEPIASLAASKTRIYSGDTVTLDASGSDPNGGESIHRYRFDCNKNDTHPSSTSSKERRWGQASPRKQCTYTGDPGETFTAGVKVRNILGEESDWATVDITIINHKPVAYFTISKRVGQAPLKVDLDANGSYDPDGDIDSMEWYIDGRVTKGTPSEVETISRTFSRGLHRIKLTVTDDRGATGSRVRHVWAVGGRR